MHGNQSLFNEALVDNPTNAHGAPVYKNRFVLSPSIEQSGGILCFGGKNHGYERRFDQRRKGFVEAA
jgi:hypothetical protein